MIFTTSFLKLSADSRFSCLRTTFVAVMYSSTGISHDPNRLYDKVLSALTTPLTKTCRKDFENYGIRFHQDLLNVNSRNIWIRGSRIYTLDAKTQVFQQLRVIFVAKMAFQTIIKRGAKAVMKYKMSIS